MSARALTRAVALIMCLVFTSPEAQANVYLAKDEALALAFPEGTEVTEKTAVLSSAQKTEIETRSHSKLPTGLFHYFEGKKNGETTGYAVIDSRIMRTNLAVFMVVLSKELVLQKVVLLAFNEPTEYQPTEGWLKQLEGDKAIGELVPGQGLPPIAGSTLSVSGLSDGVRAVRASFEVVFKDKK